MFTGIIEEVGSVASIRKGAHSRVLTVNASRVLEDVHLGDSIATNGVCLTVTSFTSHSFSADVMHETLNRSSLGSLHIGSPVNLERAMLAGGRFGGHIVSGHIDGVGTISFLSKKTTMRFGILLKLPVTSCATSLKKGPLPLMGLALRLLRLPIPHFSVPIIPHTRAQTNLASKKVGDVLNLENDLVGKYVERLMLQPIAASQEQPEQKSSGITKEFLSHYGF